MEHMLHTSARCLYSGTQGTRFVGYASGAWGVALREGQALIFGGLAKKFSHHCSEVFLHLVLKIAEGTCS